MVLVFTHQASPRKSWWSGVDCAVVAAAGPSRAGADAEASHRVN